MQVAAVAYDRLTPAVRAKADALIRLNPQYGSWVASWPPGKAAQFAFVRASTWADDIQEREFGYVDRRDRIDAPSAGRNIGYYDDFMHRYWHFKHVGFSTDGTPVEEAAPVNALTQIKMFIAGLSPSSGLPDDVRSYDLVWLLHLVGDAHQPLHTATRFSQDHPHGDAGGNLVKVVPATGETTTLHAYWDRLLGIYSSPAYAILDALIDRDIKLPEADATAASNLDPDSWFKDGGKLAREFVYAEPVRSGKEPILLDRQYETNARNLARQQTALAGARLAKIINNALK
jgi:hypothetical protein